MINPQRVELRDFWLWHFFNILNLTFWFFSTGFLFEWSLSFLWNFFERSRKPSSHFLRSSPFPNLPLFLRPSSQRNWHSLNIWKDGMLSQREKQKLSWSAQLDGMINPFLTMGWKRGGIRVPCINWMRVSTSNSPLLTFLGIQSLLCIGFQGGCGHRASLWVRLICDLKDEHFFYLFSLSFYKKIGTGKWTLSWIFCEKEWTRLNSEGNVKVNGGFWEVNFLLEFLSLSGPHRPWSWWAKWATKRKLFFSSSPLWYGIGLRF